MSAHYSQPLARLESVTPTFYKKKNMKRECLIVLSAVLAGCTTPMQRSPGFADAVQTSLERSEEISVPVISVQKDGSVWISERPISLADLAQLLEDPSMPNPPAVIIQGHPEAKNDDVRTVMEACCRLGIWRVKLRHMNNPDGTHSQTMDSTK